MPQAKHLDDKINCIPVMINLKRLAAHSRCKIKAWKLTDRQAFMVARHLSIAPGASMYELHESMRAGEAKILGVKVTVTD